MKTKISKGGRIVIPAKMRNRDGIKAGEEFEIKRIGPGIYRLRCKKNRRGNRGLIDWLVSCPTKGYFVPITSR